ncbi:MAG TPA: glycosyltransferase family 1 protein [Stellaceae bacterium]|nr:glycosyltransferase family 1 protein [Stellaceae bacterium]
MRAFYLDPGLHDDVGHHANYCRYIVDEFRSRGVETLVFGHHELPPALQSELGAAPHFRVYTYTNNDDDPFCPWLTGFDTLTRRTCEDLSRLPAIESADIVVMTSVRPVQLAALIEWRRALPPDRRPTIVVESVSTGLEVRLTSDSYRVSVPDPRIDPRAVLFRYVALRLPREPGARFHFAAFAPMPAQLFMSLLAFPVQMLPLPYRAVAPLRSRAGARPVHVSILGHQRLAKGYERLPDIVRELLRSRGDIRLLVQSVAPSDSPQTQLALRDIAANNDRMMLEEMPAGGSRWPQLLEMTDLVLCPHRAEFYVAGFSSVLAETLANGIPAVVPGGSPLATLLEECGGPGTSFEQFEPAAIVAATSRALDRFDHFAALAHAAALRWPETRGSARLVDELMSLATRP